MVQSKASAWKALEQHAQSIRFHLPQILTQPSPRQQFSASLNNIHLDYSNQHVTSKTLDLLISLANACSLRDKINALMRGDIVNPNENQPALHTALRTFDTASIIVNHHNVMSDIVETRHRIRKITEQVHAKQWLGFSEKPITDIVNIGIGGSDLGPRFCLQALIDFTANDLNYHFISDGDPCSFADTVANLNPETTLFIIASKSFSTHETIYNAKKAMQWIGSSTHYDQHFIAVTACAEKARELGINNVLPIWSWIGGRYSFCSAINLIGAIALGFDQFSQILAGAYAMDKHFQESDFSVNLPVLLALLGVWNNNFLHIHNLLFLVYSQRLEYFVPYIQQLDMESNGKSIDIQGKAVNYATAPLVWGGLGNRVQHSYYQLLCQGTHKVTADFISLDVFHDEIINEMCRAKINSLTAGVKADNNPRGYIPGNMPLNHIHLNTYTPFNIGALIALYEHKTFVQSVIWNINPFDQPGVERAKRDTASYPKVEEKRSSV